MKTILAIVLCALPVYGQGISQPSITVQGINNIIYVDGVKYQRTTTGVQAAVNQAEAAGCTKGGQVGSGGGKVVLTPGIYFFGSTGVVITCNRVHLEGAGKGATEIDFCGPGTAFTFKTGSTMNNTVLYQPSIGGMLISGACDSANANYKTAIRLVDVSEAKVTDIAVLYWSGNSGNSTTPSTGLEIEGRELSDVEDNSWHADRPIHFMEDPNIHAESLDSWYFKNNYMIGNLPTVYDITFDNGITAYRNTFVSTQCVGGAGCIYWSDNGTASSNSFGNTFITTVTEQTANASNYSFYFGRSSGSPANILLTMIGTQSDQSQNGLFLQRTYDFILENTIYAGTGDCLKADSTNFSVGEINTWCAPGSTRTNNSLPAGSYGMSNLNFNSTGTQILHFSDSAGAIKWSFNIDKLDNLELLDAAGAREGYWDHMDKFLHPNGISTYGPISTTGAIQGNSVQGTTLHTTYNCTAVASPAACGDGAAGSLVIPAGSNSILVDTTAVTAISQILVMFDSSLGTRLSVTCNTVAQAPYVTTRTAGTSFTVSVTSNFVTNPGCLSYSIIN